MTEQVMPQGTGDSGKRSCCFYGCIGLVVVGIIVLVAAGGLGYFFYGKIGQLVEDFTDTEPVELPTTDLAPEEQADLDSKVTALNAALEGQSEEKTFSLTADDLNGLLDMQKDPPFGDWIHLSIEEGTVTGQVSLPLSETPAAVLGQGRYFNGTGTFDVSIEQGALRVYLVEAQVKGSAIPEEAMQQIRMQNLAKDLRDPKLLDLFAKVKDLRVEGDHIVLELK